MTGHLIREAATRVLPKVTERNEAFWRGGEHGTLMIQRCDACGFYIHPPSPICPRCRTMGPRPEAVSGYATVYTFTVNYYPSFVGLDPPYVIAEVELDEQEGLRVLTNILGDPEAVSIGMLVEVVFALHEDIYVPLFRAVSPSQ